MSVTVAIGPETKYPSWRWVGADTAIELKKYFTVTMFDAGQLPSADIVLVIKQIPSLAQILAIKNAGSRIIYCPIDYFSDESHIAKSSVILKYCDLILLHTESLLSHFERYAPVDFVDHHSKFVLPGFSEYKESGYILWIGAFQNLPFLLQYLRTNRMDLEIRLLSDWRLSRARSRAAEIAATLGISMRIENDRVEGMEIVEWSPEAQRTMLCEAKAAIDIKGADFNQQNKPPAKAQQFILSGIPIAMNSCEPARHFERRGLKIPQPQDSNWLSRGYHARVVEVGQALKPLLTIGEVTMKYRYIIDRLARMSPL